MNPRAVSSRRFATASALLLAGAALARVLTLALSPPVRAAEVFVSIGVLLTLALSARVSRVWSGRGAMLVLYSLTAALIASLGLRLVASTLPDYTMFASLIFAAILLSIDVTVSRGGALASGAVVLVVFVELWLDTVALDATEIGSLIVAVVLLGALELLLLSQAERARALVTAETVRGRIFTSLAHRLGVAGDLGSVSFAVLEVCREAFPRATAGGVFVRDDVDGMLKSSGVALTASGVALVEPPYELAPGEGLGGSIFTRGEPAVWETTLDVSRAHGSLRETNRQRMRDVRMGFVRSAIGAPLRVGDDVIGCIVLVCHAAERAWSRADIGQMQTIAGEAARNIERARRHEADLGHALLDGVTGLATQRQLLAVLDKELARARRNDQTLAVLHSDISGFRAINSAWGQEVGNRILRVFADVLRATLRREDTAARFGGDEFVCVLPGADGAQAGAVAARIAERFQEATRHDPAAGAGGATAAGGFAVFPFDGDSASSLVTAAREAATAHTENLPGRAHLWRRADETAGPDQAP